jgi:hypothetical protein
VRICPPHSRILIPLKVHHLGTFRDLGFEYETLCVHQDVALAAIDLLATIVTALLCATLDRLGINHACAGLWI